MAGKREERKKARFHWLVTSWLIVAAVIIVGVGGIILFMNGLYHKEMRKENAQLPQMLESSRDAKWAYAFNGESQTESESESESQLESKLQTESELQLESTEEQSIVSTVIEKEETQTQTQADVSSKAEPAHNVVIGDIKSEKPTYVSLVAVGDNLMHYDVSMSGLQADGSYNYDYNFAYVRDIVQAADLAVINQECVIGGDQWGIKDYPCFNVRTEVAAAIANAGFDVVLAATNHVLDIGKVGSLYMVDFFRNNYPQLTLLGIHDSWETRDEIHVIEKNDIKIGMINYTDILNCKGDYNADGQYLVDMLDYDRLATLIQRTKEASDFVIVFPHWGTEYNLGTDASQTEQAAFLAAQGVDLVIGTHPHVVEPIDYIDRPDGGKMLIYYSLGNFQSLQRKEATLLGGMAKVTIKKDFKGARIVDFDMETLVTDYRLGGVRVTDYFDIITTYPWSKYSRAIAESGNIGNGNANFNLDYMFQLQAEQAAQVHEARQKAGLE